MDFAVSDHAPVDETPQRPPVCLLKRAHPHVLTLDYVYRIFGKTTPSIQRALPLAHRTGPGALTSAQPSCRSLLRTASSLRTWSTSRQEREQDREVQSSDLLQIKMDHDVLDDSAAAWRHGPAGTTTSPASRQSRRLRPQTSSSSVKAQRTIAMMI